MRVQIEYRSICFILYLSILSYRQGNGNIDRPVYSHLSILSYGQGNESTDSVDLCVYTLSIYTLI